MKKITATLGSRMALAAALGGLCLACTQPGEPPPEPCHGAPTVPAGLVATAKTSRGVTLSWEASTSAANCTTDYIVSRGDGSLNTRVSGTSATIRGLRADTTYSFSVSATNSYSPSPQSPSISVTTDPAPAARMEIRTWVPPYGQSVWKAALEANTGGAYHPKNTLTSVAAQFFHIQSNGAVFLDGVSSSDVTWTSDYCYSNGIKFLVCITNYNSNLAHPDFDWTLATSAFGPNRDALISSILSAVETWSADGVNIDFEGYVDEATEASTRTAFKSFIQELGTQLHSLGKELTVAVYPYIWNAPNMNAIGDWVGYVDGIDSMGYDGLYGGPGPSEWNAYKWQQDKALAAGYKSHQFDMGMPGWLGTWGQGGLGTTVLNHLSELQSGKYNTKPTSICIWDAQFNGSGWLDAEVWAGLHAIRTTPIQ